MFLFVYPRAFAPSLPRAKPVVLSVGQLKFAVNVAITVCNPN